MERWKVSLKETEEKLKDILSKEESFPILCAYRGSIAHGLYIPSDDPDSIDDIDFMSIFINPFSFYVGITGTPEQESQVHMVDEVDHCGYEIRKMFKLLARNNPNVMSLLWVPEDKIVIDTFAARELRWQRDMFSSKLCFHSFVGYANGQMKKMEATAGHGYRGEKRKELFHKFGYDCKNASHCIRLMRMCVEFLKEGRFNIDRTNIDRQELLDIKLGKWTKEAVKQHSVELYEDAKVAYERCDLPEQPDLEKINSLTMDIMGDHFGFK